MRSLATSECTISIIQVTEPKVLPAVVGCWLYLTTVAVASRLQIQIIIGENARKDLRAAKSTFEGYRYRG